MTYTSRARLLGFALGMLLLGAHAHATTTRYVAPTGNDSASGTLTAPFRTIAKGLSVTKPGDTLLLRGGTYNEALGYPGPQLPKGTSWSNAITIGGYPGERVTLLRGVNVSSFLGDFYVIVQDLHFDTKASGQGGAFLGSNYIRLLRVDIGPWHVGDGSTTGGNGVQITGDHNEVLHSTIHADNNGTARSHCFYIAGSDNRIEGNEIHHCPGLGIQQYKYNASDSHRNVITNNDIHHNGGSDNTTGLLLSSGTGNQAIGNRVHDNGGPGLVVDYRCQQCVVEGNVVWGNQGDGIGLYSVAQPATTGTQVRNNRSYSNRTAAYVDRATGTTQSGNIWDVPGAAAPVTPPAQPPAPRHLRVLTGQP